MRRGNYMGRGGNFGGSGNSRGDDGGRNVSGPLITNHLRDLDLELELLKCKREMYQEEQNRLERYSNNHTDNAFNISNKYSRSSEYHNANFNQPPKNSNKRQYDNNQQGTSEQFNFADYSSAYQPGPRPSNDRMQRIKRANPVVWDNSNSSPPKRFNTFQSNISPWENQNTRQAEFRAINHNAPQPKNYSSQTMAQKSGIGQRISNRYNAPPEHRNFKPSKVTKPNHPKAGTKAPVYRPSAVTRKLIYETNKLLAHSNMVIGPINKGQNPPSKVQNRSPKVQNIPPKVQNIPPKKESIAANTIPKRMRRIEQDTVLRPDKQPSGQVKGRLELALGMILKSVKELCPDSNTREYFNIPFIQRIIKHTLRVRIRNVMMNESVEAVTSIVDKYRQKYPEDTDVELMKIAQDAHEYNNNHRRVLHLVDADCPEDFFRKNINRVLHNKLHDVCNDLRKLYGNKEYNLEKLVASFPDISDTHKKDKTQVNEKAENVEMVSTEQKDTNGETLVTSGENKTDGDKDEFIIIDADEEKTTNEEEEKSSEDGKGVDCENNQPQKKASTECSSADVENITQQLDAKCYKTQKYVEFMEALIEKKMSKIFHNFRDELVSILCSDTDFLSMQALIVLELKIKLQQKLEKEKGKIVTIQDEEETSDSAKAATTRKAGKATNAATRTNVPANATSVIDLNASGAVTAKQSATTPAKPSATAATPTAPAITPVNPAAASTKPATPATDAGKPATPASVQSSTPATPVKSDVKSLATTPKTPASKDVPYYVKLIGRPALPTRAVIYDFLNKFNPTSIKKHKTIANLLVIGFTDKEAFEKILTANEAVVGDNTIFIKASEQVSTPVQNKTPQQGMKIPAQTDNSKNITEENVSSNAENQKKPENNSSTNDILTSDLDSQISDLLLSIRKADEDENIEPNVSGKPKEVQKMDTANTDDKVAELTKKEEKLVQDKEMVEETKQIDDTETTTDDSNIAKGEEKNLDTIMEVDDDAKKTYEAKAKAVVDIAKTAKESGRSTPTRASTRLAAVTPSTIKTRRASRLENN